MAETKREEDSQASTEQCTEQPTGTSNQTANNHNQASSSNMHTKLAAKDTQHVPSSQNTHTLSEPPTTATPPTTQTHLPSPPDIEISEEAFPSKNSEPNSPISEEDFSSGGEQIPFQDDPKGYISHQYYMMPGTLPLPNGVSGAGADGSMMSGALPNTAWGGASDVGIPEGSYIHVMDSAPYLPHSQPIDGQMTSDPMSPPPEGEGLRSTLIRQLEYYFSKENLSSDKYLLSQMDGDQFVSVSVIAGFAKVKRLTTDLNMIMDAIRESAHLQLDDSLEKVRAVPEKRCVLILREIPKETPPEQIRGLFASDHCPNYSTCEFAENDCWYITFASEEDTQKAFAYLREEVRDFLGHPIRARIKGTSAQRPASSVSKKPHFYPSVQNVYNGQQPMPYFSQPMSQWAPYYHSDPNYMPYVNGYPPSPPQGYGPPNHYQNHPPMSHSHPSHSHPPPSTGDRLSAGGRVMTGGGSGGGRSYSNHSNYSSHGNDRGDRRGHSGGGGGAMSGSSNGNVGGREEREGRRDRERERERDREQYGGSSGGGGGRRGKEEDSKKSIPPRLNRKQQARDGESSRGQRHPPQKAIDHSPAHFPPLAGGSTIPTAPPPPPPPPETNLADIVKGKRPKESTSPTGSAPGAVSAAPSSTPGQKEQHKPPAPTAQPTKPVQTQKEATKISAAPSKPLTAVAVSSSSSSNPSSLSSSATPSSTTPSPPSTSSQPPPPPPPSQPSKPAAISNGAPPSAQANGGSVPSTHTQPPKPPRSDVKVGSAKDSVRVAPSSKGSYRSGDREYNNTRTNRSQVFNRSEGRPPSTGRGRYRDRDRSDRDRDKDNKRPGNNYRTQSRPSPKPLRKQAPPPPPTPPPTQTDKSLPTSTTTASRPDNSGTATGSTGSSTCNNISTSDTPSQPAVNVAKSDGRLSYAQMAQKAPVPPPLKVQQPPSCNSNTNGSSASGGTSPPSTTTTTTTSTSTAVSTTGGSAAVDKDQVTSTVTTNSSERSSNNCSTIAGSCSSSTSSSSSSKKNCEQTHTVSSRASPEGDSQPPHTPSKKSHSSQDSGSRTNSTGSSCSRDSGDVSVALSTPLPLSPPSSSATTTSPDQLSLTS